MTEELNQSYITRGEQSILGTYKRFPVTFKEGKGSFLYDTQGKKYLDFGSGIAVTSLGHGNSEIAEVIKQQALTITHASNLYYTIPQIELAEKLLELTGPGKVFFSNSGAEANECLIKLARAYGNASDRHEIITMKNSFHGRTMGGIAATGQEKVKTGFEPMLEGFTHVSFNDMHAIEEACSDKTAAILIEGIQGEGGIITASPEYLLALRAFCSKEKILLLFDAIQCGFFRSGSFQSYEEILKGTYSPFKPDAVAMAKSLGGGFPIGATWISEPYTSVLGPGSHGSTFGGNALATKTALKIIQIIERDSLIKNIQEMGQYLHESLRTLMKKNPSHISGVRGLGLLQGCVLHPFPVPDPYTSLPPSSYLCLQALKNGLLLVPAGEHVVRFIPQYRVNKEEIDEGIQLFSQVIAKIP
jgi:acetylornithine/N-succinyldiaminopimelate aminotransferase